MSVTLKWTSHEDLGVIRNPTVGRNEFLDYMTFESNERPLFTEIFGPILGLKEEWEAQGASPQELDFSAFRYRCESRGYVPVHTGFIGGQASKVLEETEDFKVWRDPMGRRMKLSKRASTLPLPLDFPVKSFDDWLKIKPHYLFSEARFSKDWALTAQRYLEHDRVVCVGILGGFDEPRQLMGEEMLCLAYYDQPELVHDILNTITDTAFKVLERVSSLVQIDLLSVHEDMAGVSGPLIGPDLVREFVAPYYRRIWDMLCDRGARLFDQDSDGDMNPVIDAFLDAGVNCMHPMEPAAHMDIVSIRKKYGTRLAFYGGIDKHVLRRTQAEITQELEYKVPPMIESGGCIIALDHRIPNGTPIENYRFYVNKVWEFFDNM